MASVAVAVERQTTFRNVIISGGARGIGRAFARMFLEAGHRVYIFDIDEDELEHTTKVHLKAYHEDGRLRSALCDLRNVEDIRAKVKEAAEFFNSHIDVLINNGGIASPFWRDGKDMENPDTISEWQAYMETNLTAPFAMSQACIPYMKARLSDAQDGAHKIQVTGPCIIHIGSFRAHQSDANQEGYASSKAGLLGLMHSMAISLGAFGIRVNLIAPGRIKVAHESKEGDEAGTNWEGQISDKDIADHPTNRAGRPRDVVDAALYLIDAGFVTGQEITVDGGALKMKKRITISTTRCSFLALRPPLTARVFTCRAFTTTTLRLAKNSALESLQDLASKHQKSCSEKTATYAPPRPVPIAVRAHFHAHSGNNRPGGCNWKRDTLLEPLHIRNSVPEPKSQVHGTSSSHHGSMTSSVEIITTPTADTPGTTLLLRTARQHYVFGSQGEGVQRAMVQQGTRLLKAQDFFLTGRTEWKNIGGLVGSILTLSDSATNSYSTAWEVWNKNKKGEEPSKPHFNVYGPPNLKHAISTCRRFIFRTGAPLVATEYSGEAPEKHSDNGDILPSWEDSNIQVWALAVSPANQEVDAQAEADLESRRRFYDANLNAFEEHQASENESTADREARYDRIRALTVKYMFDSNWSFDKLVERHISEVETTTPMYVRNHDTHGYVPYTGPKPGGQDALPDITVWTRTPWPGAKIMALPPTKPAPQCVSYIVRTFPARGAFDVKRAKELGVKPGPTFGKLSSGESVQNEKGEWITPDQVLGPDKPGQGIAILDVPSIGYLKSIVQREELTSAQVMSGIGAVVWILGPGLASHPILHNFMNKLANVEHVISSVDSCPNRLTFDSVAGQTTRLAHVDPTRYTIPMHDCKTLPQNSLYGFGLVNSSPLPKEAVVADRGMTFTLMPKFVKKADSVTPLFNPTTAMEHLSPEVIELAKLAQQAVKDDHKSMQTWRQLVARPDTEVTTLGTGSALPSKYRNVSATLVRVPGVGNYLFDCGENTLGQLQRMFQPEELVQIIKDLRMIWISHLHADHHLGTASVIRAWYAIKHGSVPNSKPFDTSSLVSNASEYGLSIISHRGMIQWLHEYSSVEDFGYSRILPLEITPVETSQSSGSYLSVVNALHREESGKKIEQKDYETLIGFSDIQSVKVSHCHGSMAVCVTFPPSSSDPAHVKPLKVSYSGDCRPSWHFATVGRDTTVLIHEATFDDELAGDAKAKKHSTTSEALRIGAKMEAKTVVLTHFSQRYQKIPVLQTVQDGEQEDTSTQAKESAEDAVHDEEGDGDTTMGNPDIRPTPASTPAPPPSLPLQTSSLQQNGRIVRIRNKDMKVAIAFDYMRVKIGEIVELDKFNEALNELLVKEKDDEVVLGEGAVNGNGKRGSEDEQAGKKKKDKKSKRNN
ncbi:hypothetical protein P153DRAFT_360857 [Dothidotthia symphoricarpi CBS 119687]|uniref:ribonuclease Z n=1 Tax=Dothidotthia symphoricarpi CBS 119687 TaxID=1392245 RepID=A0A6A5ZYI8_9PLEO|nr:uncharacterized protein P153DRAFT_360857 [Dothidotthia symphoricarpi CBS 119687]KAF2124660.1 hypothetical protein P153DRAFT_360857 [Dothidotthia symphoricarpi CBS 119687]